MSITCRLCGFAGADAGSGYCEPCERIVNPRPVVKWLSEPLPENYRETYADRVRVFAGLGVPEDGWQTPVVDIFGAFNREFITVDAPDDWTCHCGNVCHSDGFYPCNRDGHEIEPLVGVWVDHLSCCGWCGRILTDDGRVVGKKGVVSAVPVRSAWKS